MAANPVERAIQKQIRERGGWERVLERMASGETQVAICQEFINPKTGVHISPGFFNRVLHNDPERSKAADAAMRLGASVMVDIGLEKVNDAPLDRDAIQKARVQLDAYLRVAALRDRERFGAQPQVAVQVTVTDLHLNSLRHRITEASRPLADRLGADAREARPGQVGSGNPSTPAGSDSDSAA